MATYVVDSSAFLGTLVFDFGSVTTRAGFAGDDTPRALYPSTLCCAGPSSSGGLQAWGVVEHDAHLPTETLAAVQARDLVLPSGRRDEGVLNGLLHHGLQRLGCASWAEHPLLLSEPTGALAAERRRTAELVFEELGAPALCVVRAAELAAVAAARPTAVVLEAGADSSSAAVVIDGALAPRSLQTSPLGGTALAAHFARSIEPSIGAVEPGCTLRARCHDSLTRVRTFDVQRAMCEASLRCSELTSAVKAQAAAQAASAGRKRGPPPPPPKEEPGVDYTLPDGRTVHITDAQRVAASETLFEEVAVGEAGATSTPLQRLALNAIGSVDTELHKELLKNVVFTGGVASMPGLPERLDGELRDGAVVSPLPSLVTHAHRIAVAIGSPHDRRHGAWLGGSILGSMASHQGLWMSRAEYDEHGATLIGRRGMQYAW